MKSKAIGLRISGREECLALVGSAPLGRVVFTRQALPAVQPVSFVLDAGGDVIVLTAPDSELAAALPGAIVAFQADGFDASGSGWSVTITGRAGPATEPADLPPPAPVPPWPSGSGVRLIRIANQLMNGLRLQLLVTRRDGCAA
jgi:hypothetical protein